MRGLKSVTARVKHHKQRVMTDRERDNLIQDYTALKALHYFGINIKFNDFDGLAYRFLSDEKNILVSHRGHGIAKIISLSALIKECHISPFTISEFFDVNGASEVGLTGKPVDADHKIYRSGANLKLDAPVKMVYLQVGPRGFWKLVAVPDS